MVGAIVGRVRKWIYDEALPLWGSAGVDRLYGGFVEQLDETGRPVDVGYKRTRAVARQVYVFSHAATLGWGPGEEIAEQGMEFLCRSSWLGPDKGWARRVSTRGDVLDATADLYDLAFVLFAMAWRYRQSGDERALRLAHATLDFIQSFMRQGRGFAHELPPRAFRLQNPHMHLLEAALAAFEASGDDRFLDQAGELVDLFATCLFDGRTLAEQFDGAWRRTDDVTVEPGHHFEWAWILAQHQRLSGVRTVEHAQGLIDFAERFGLRERAVVNLLSDSGQTLDAGTRVWPNTERIKGHLALFELIGTDPWQAVSEAVDTLFDRHLCTERRGLWIERRDAGASAVPGHSPSSSLYHLFLAFSEVMRLGGAVETCRDVA